MSKEEVKTKIINYCRKYDIPIPNFDNYFEVKRAADRINKTCRFCSKYKGDDMSVICGCELHFAEEF